MENTKVFISFFLFSKLNRLIEELKFIMKDDTSLDYNSFLESNSLHESIQTQDNTIILFCIENKDDFLKVSSLIKMNKPLVQDKRIRFAGFNLSGDNSIEENLKKIGCRDIFGVKEANAKKLKFKMALWKKMLKAPAYGSVAAAKPAEEKKEQAPSSSREGSSPDVIGFRREIRAALNIERDYWFIKSDKNCEFKGDKWDIALEGPSSQHCFWDKSKKIEGVWELFPTNSAPEKLKDLKGAWLFKGDKPEFLPDGQWHFSGKVVKLYYREPNAEYIRFESLSRILSIAQNSYANGQVIQSDKPIAHGKSSGPALAPNKVGGPSLAPNKIGGAVGGPSTVDVLEQAVIKEITQEAKIELKVYPVYASGVASECEFGHLEDYFQSEVSIKLPHGKFKDAKEFCLKFMYQYGQKKLNFELRGTVDERDSYDDENDMIVLHMPEFDPKLLERFLEAYSQRQGNINQFLKKASGRD